MNQREENLTMNNLNQSGPIPVGSEPENIKKRLAVLLPKLDAAYPKKIVSGLSKDHKKWAETVTELRTLLGYINSTQFLNAYGYSVVVNEVRGGRPSTDAEMILNELKRRYPNGSPFDSVGDLTIANPDLAGNLKTLQNQGKLTLGTTLKKYLTEQGILVDKISVTDQQYDELIAELKRRYEQKQKPTSIKQLTVENPDLSLTPISQKTRTSMTTVKEILFNEGLLLDTQSIKEEITENFSITAVVYDRVTAIEFANHHFTFTKQRADRLDVACRSIKAAGGYIDSNPTKNTDYLVITPDFLNEERDEKAIKSVLLIRAQGKNVKIITFDDFCAFGEFRDVHFDLLKQNHRRIERQENATNIEVAKTAITVSFGKYEWLVLAKNGDNALLITKDIIKNDRFSAKHEQISYEDCSLRQWLNIDFYFAFSREERNRIVSTMIKNESAEYSDVVFLLSAEEAEAYFSSKTHLKSKQQERPYQVNWLLRTQLVQTTSNQNYWGYTPPMRIACIDGNGEIDTEYGRQIDNYYGIRPAMWVNLKETLETHGAEEQQASTSTNLRLAIAPQTPTAQPLPITRPSTVSSEKDMSIKAVDRMAPTEETTAPTQAIRASTSFVSVAQGQAIQSEADKQSIAQEKSVSTLPETQAERFDTGEPDVPNTSVTAAFKVASDAPKNQLVEFEQKMNEAIANVKRVTPNSFSVAEVFQIVSSAVHAVLGKAVDKSTDGTRIALCTNLLAELDNLQKNISDKLYADSDAWYSSIQHGYYSSITEPAFRSKLSELRLKLMPSARNLVGVAKAIDTFADCFGNDKAWDTLYNSSMQIVDKIADESIPESVVVNGSDVLNFKSQLSYVGSIKYSIQSKYNLLPYVKEALEEKRKEEKSKADEEAKNLKDKINIAESNYGKADTEKRKMEAAIESLKSRLAEEEAALSKLALAFWKSAEKSQLKEHIENLSVQISGKRSELQVVERKASQYKQELERLKQQELTVRSRELQLNATHSTFDASALRTLSKAERDRVYLLQRVLRVGIDNAMTANEISTAVGIDLAPLSVVNAMKYVENVMSCKVIRVATNTKGLKYERMYTAYYLE
jgi:hypothetical protein